MLCYTHLEQGNDRIVCISKPDPLVSYHNFRLEPGKRSEGQEKEEASQKDVSCGEKTSDH